MDGDETPNLDDISNLAEGLKDDLAVVCCLVRVEVVALGTAFTTKLRLDGVLSKMQQAHAAMNDKKNTVLQALVMCPHGRLIVRESEVITYPL